MNIKEVYVMNSALDGNQIFGVPDFTKLHMSDLLIDDVKKVMIEKGILESTYSFTLEGVKIVKRIEDFKRAKKYVKIASLVIGINNEKEGILLTAIPELEDYSFRRVDLIDHISCLVSSYPFLTECNCYDDAIVSEKLTIESIHEEYGLNIDNCIYLSTMDLSGAEKFEDVTITNEMIFMFEGKLYLYDRDEKLLYQKGKEKIMKILAERMAA